MAEPPGAARHDGRASRRTAGCPGSRGDRRGTRSTLGPFGDYPGWGDDIEALATRRPSRRRWWFSSLARWRSPISPVRSEGRHGETGPDGALSLLCRGFGASSDGRRGEPEQPTFAVESLQLLACRRPRGSAPTLRAGPSSSRRRVPLRDPRTTSPAPLHGPRRPARWVPPSRPHRCARRHGSPGPRLGRSESSRPHSGRLAWRRRTPRGARPRSWQPRGRGTVEVLAQQAIVCRQHVPPRRVTHPLSVAVESTMSVNRTVARIRSPGPSATTPNFRALVHSSVTHGSSPTTQASCPAGSRRRVGHDVEFLAVVRHDVHRPLIA